MQTVRWLGFSLSAIILLFCGCGGGSSNLTPPQPPSSLSYTTNSAVYTKGLAITANIPTSTGGAVISYSVSPALPVGLSLSPSTGIISGTPTAITAGASYTVTASNLVGSATATLTLTVNDQSPSGLTYTTGMAVFAVRVPIPPDTPSNTGGTVTSYGVTPALPAGLSLSTSTGIITGTPLTLTATANYMVTASNAIGSTSAILTITAAKVVPTEPATDCANITQLVLPNTQITTAELVSANSTPSTLYPGAGLLPEHCLVRGIVNPRIGVPAPAMDEYGNLTPATASDSNYGISFELRMPTTTWNGDFFFTGGSGLDGVVGEAVGATLGGGTTFPPALYRGFAVITQNSGHTSNQNPGFGYDPQARSDYGYQQTGTLTPVAKSILMSFYGIIPVYSYYLGCSNGGREAMASSQRWGNMFDGIVAGDPGFRVPHTAIAEAWDTQQFAQAALAVGTTGPTYDINGHPNLSPAASQSDLALVGQLVLQACDTLDGLQDKMIFNTAACQQAFNPATISQLQCTGVKTATCLLPAQIAAIQNVFAGPVNSQGNALYSNLSYDVGISDPKWIMWTLGVNPPTTYIPVGYPQPVYVAFPYPPTPAANITLGAQLAMYLLSSPPNPSLNVFTESMDDLNNSLNATNSTFTQSAVSYLEATSTNLDTFMGRGGKIIFFHGESDPVFSMYDTVNYYETLSSKYGTATGSFARLFLVPGMNHCSGGSYALDSFDSLAEIVNWVEQGTAPDSIIASNSFNHTSNPLSGSALPPGRTRPLCPYPQFAQYTGTGDSENAANFTCVAPSPDVVVAPKVKNMFRGQ
ncbi:MAG: tannase/feruloyl esterase family alpha/beta hydrolase [Acidobacteriota bacterium]|nr:tannase/feruloyl esterase family alpha/beta hydrolase [Acidobacteriota bacterium]